MNSPEKGNLSHVCFLIPIIVGDGVNLDSWKPWSGLESPLCLSSFLLRRRKRSQSLVSQNLGFSLATTNELVFSLVVMLVTCSSKCTLRLSSLPRCPHNQDSRPILAHFVKYPSLRLHWPILATASLNQTCLASWSEGYSNILVITFTTLSITTFIVTQSFIENQFSLIDVNNL